MPIERAFILAAGKGTRMGEIGKQLPKVLWPLFDSTLLGLQIEFLKDLGINDITINSHHLHDKLESYLKRHYPAVKVLHEPELLDAGGGVHNYLACTNSDESTFLMNSDQYLQLTTQDLEEFKRKSRGGRLCLLAMKNVGGFSGLRLDGDQLVEIVGDDHPMYVGLSILNPVGLNAVKGASKFFASVADYKHERVTVHIAAGSYIDFGTTENYARASFEIFRRILSDERQSSFFTGCGIVSLDKISVNTSSYACDQVGVLNFSGKDLQHSWPNGSIIIKEGAAAADQRAIVYGDIIAKY